MSNKIVSQHFIPVSTKVLTFDDQVLCQALLMQALSEVKGMLQNPCSRTEMRSAAVKVFNTLVSLNAAIDTSDDVVVPAHKMKSEWAMLS